MAMSEAHKRYRQNNPAHKKAEGEKRLDLIISGEAKQALADKSKAAGMTQRQLLEALILSPCGCHTGVMMPTTITPGLFEESVSENITPVLPAEVTTDTAITPGLSDIPSADSEIEAQILNMIAGGLRKGKKSPVTKKVVELYNGDHREAAKKVRVIKNRYKDTPSYESLKLLANRIDGDRPKTKPPKKRSRKNDQT